MKKMFSILVATSIILGGCSAKITSQKVNSKSSNSKLIRDGSRLVLTKDNVLIFKVVGQGVSPVNTISPAQAKALAKRAAIADAYRQLAEKIAGVKIEGRDKIVNMVTKKSLVRTCVNALIKNATIIDSRTKNGLYEVEMEIKMYGKTWYPLLASN